MPHVPTFAADRAVDRAAAEAFAAAELPSAEEEEWRYSRVGELDLGRYTPSDPATAGGQAVPETAEAVLALAEGIGSVGIVTIDGHLAARRDLGGQAKGLDIDGEPADAGPAPDPFVTLNTAFASPIRITTTPGAAVDPVVLVHWLSGSGVAAFPRLVVEAGADSDVAVLELFVSADDADALVVPLTHLSVGKAARVGHLVVQDLGQQVWQLGRLDASVDADATLTATAAALGGGYARLRTDCRLVGRGATGNLRALWFGEAEQTLDFRTFQQHAGPDTVSDLVYKGAVAGSSRSVYTGLIKVEEEARGTDARQTNRNLKLSDDAWAESVPNLEIRNNDVRCAHASSVGPIDEEQRWYVESRGVPTAVAERLIVAGFFEEILETLPIPAVAGPLRENLAGKLDRSGVAA